MMNVANGYPSGGFDTNGGTSLFRPEIIRSRSTKLTRHPEARPRTGSAPNTPKDDSKSLPEVQSTMPQQHPHVATTKSPVHDQIHRHPSEASRLRAVNNGYRIYASEPQHGLEREATEAPVENFSRPRKPSFKKKNESPTPMPISRSHPPQVHRGDQMLILSGDRGASVSLLHSATQFTAQNLRPSASIPDYQTPESIHSRQRALNNSSYRPSRGLSKPDSYSTSDSNYVVNKGDSQPQSSTVDGEELRSSFRSAVTTNSSFLGTSETERSSLLTKRSSATSLCGRDDVMSVDDAIGMYEAGFTDSGIEDNNSTRPDTSNPEKKISGLEEAINDTLLPPPHHVIIRDSAAMFRIEGRETPNTNKESSLGMDDGHFELQDGRSEQISLAKPLSLGKETFDDTRDRYGFRKNTQYVPLELFEAWNGPYTEYLNRRKRKWASLMRQHNLPTSNPQIFPSKSDKIKRFVRKGIPPSWRGAAWFYYAGGPAMLAKNPGVYADLVQRALAGGVTETDDEIIERDLNRTFPDNVMFKPDLDPRSIAAHEDQPETPILQALRRVLQAFSIYHPKIGYCQSLNFLAGLLLLFMPEEKAFWMLNIITRVYLPGTHSLTLEGANIDLGVLMASVKDMMPSVWAKIGNELDGSPAPTSVTSLRLPPITLCTTAWFMSCFIGTLPIESTLRVWDSFFYEGSKTLFRIALTIFKLGEAEIKAVNDPMEIFQVVQGIPRCMVDCNKLMETCFKRRGGFVRLSQDDIEKGRAERRKGYAEERERVANGATMPIMSASRKGSIKRAALFGMGKKS